MKNLIFLFLGVFLFFSNLSFSQSEPVLYFCEKYDSRKGEVNVSDRFTRGAITVVVKSDYALDLEDVAIQYDKYNPSTGKFEFYKKFYFTIDPDMKYVYFSKNDESDMKFEEPGFYRVFLLDDLDKTVTSSLIEIIK